MKEIFSGFAFVRGDRIYLFNLGGERVIKVDFMVIGLRWWNMVCGFFREDKGELREFRREGLFRFHFFSSNGELCGGGDFGNIVFKRQSSIEETRATTDNSVKDSVVVGTREELGFFFPTIVFEES